MKKIIAIILTLAIVFTFSACSALTEFQCSAIIKINDNDHFGLLSSYITLLESNTALAKIANNLDFEISINELKNSIHLQDMNYTDTVEITVLYNDENQARQILDTLLEQYPLILKEYSSTLKFTVVSKSTNDSK